MNLFFVAHFMIRCGVGKKTIVAMSKNLKRGEAFLRFILDSYTSEKETRGILENLSEKNLTILSEIFYNLLKNQEILRNSSKKIVYKKKRFLNKFIFLGKLKNKSKQKKFLKKNLKIIFLVLKTFKKLILEFL